MSLVLNPEYRASPPIQRPDDMHPLPGSIEAYCVYPFSLEERILSGKQFPQSKDITAKCERHKGFLKQREQKKIQLEKERMRRMAPGWTPDQVLSPTQVHHSDKDSYIRSSSITPATLTETTPVKSKSAAKPLDLDLSVLGSPIYSVDSEAPVSHSGDAPLVNPTAHVKIPNRGSPLLASKSSHNDAGHFESIHETDDESGKLSIEQLTRGFSEF
ncbi:hypothetical protein MYAM1_004043 [Malassezia yamatoensis]|uniref:Uncharacterized protein n=1 Tax=Malassezia yamatoensis TaxID=253288 RepID=A0AAJ5YVZ3_9BASI|nr:hypothetical protein MYAM1_004043 [Malassezia yamatoensis]